MIKRASILLSFIFSALICMGAPFPLNSAFLQTDLNGNQKKITNLLELDVTTLNATNLNINNTNVGLNITNLPLATFPLPYFRFPFANTNTGSNGAIRYDDLEAALASQISPSFPWLIVTNGSSTATIQAQFNSLTNGGVISPQPGNFYDITTNIFITNKPIILIGNGSEFRFNTNASGPMLDTGTNYNGSLVIDNLRFNGQTFIDYRLTNFLHLEPRAGTLDANPYFNSFWSNRTGLRAEVSRGVIINNCYFYGFSGNGALFTSIVGGAQYFNPKLLFLNNHCYTNFCSVMLACTAEDTQGYYNNSTAGQGSWPCEYGMLAQNDIFMSYIGVSASPGNVIVNDNTINENMFGLMQASANGNQGHGRYSNNTFNHNVFPIWVMFASGGEYMDNIILRNGQDLQPPNSTNIYYPFGSTSGVHFELSYGVQFNNNKLTREYLTFTNNCFGTFAHNTYGSLNVAGIQNQVLGDSNLVWGVDVPTNFSSGMRVYGNIENLGILHDGTMASILSISSNTPSAGSLPYTTDGTNRAAWTSQIGITTNGSFASATNSVIPYPVAGKVIWWYSNYDGWIITPTKTNRVFQGQ